MPPEALPRWRCGEPGCRRSRAWQWVPGATPDDLEATQRAYDAHYDQFHPELVEEVESVGHALAA